MGRRQAVIEQQRAEGRGVVSEPFLVTLVSHGIPWRATLLGVIAGSMNTGIVLAVTAAASGVPANPPWALIAQAFSLPILFGVLSQALAYRRAAGALTQASIVV